MNIRNRDSLECEIMNRQKSELLTWVIERLKYPKGNFNSNNIDASELASLMQCLGFTLDNFEKLETNEIPDDFDENVVTISILCNKSQMKAVLTKPLLECNCPQREDANNAYIWNVTGCEPQSDERINVSNTSILPVVSPKKNKIITELLQKILQLINDPDVDEKINEDINQKSLKEEINKNKNAQKIESNGEDTNNCINKAENEENKDDKNFNKAENTENILINVGINNVAENEINKKSSTNGRKSLNFNEVDTAKSNENKNDIPIPNSNENLNTLKENNIPIIDIQTVENEESKNIVSPPKLTSSPLDSFVSTPNMTNNVGNFGDLKTILENINKFSEEGLDWIAKNSSGKKKRLSDIKRKDDPSTPFKGAFINMNRTQVKDFPVISRVATPKTPLAANRISTPGERKSLMNPPSKITVPKKKTPMLSRMTEFLGKENNRSPNVGKSPKPRNDTPRPKILVNTPTGENIPMGVSRLRQTGIPKRK